jgi:hypothetical protein
MKYSKLFMYITILGIVSGLLSAYLMLVKNSPLISALLATTSFTLLFTGSMLDNKSKYKN